MRALITGVAGVIGSDLAVKLLAKNNIVVGIDNLSGGRLENLQPVIGHPSFTFIEGDVLKDADLDKGMRGCDIVFHLSAKSDIKTIDEDDFNQNTIATYEILDKMRNLSVGKIVFSSSSAIYGEPDLMPTPENYGPLLPVSLYGAAKLSSEALISSYAHLYGIKSWIFRFANIVSAKSRKKGTTVITDFIDKLKKNNKFLEILGDGKQTKSYLHVDDCIEGVLSIVDKTEGEVNVFNLGPKDQVSVLEIAGIVHNALGIEKIDIKLTGGSRGWPGDVPKMLLDCSKAYALGWMPHLNSRQAVEKAVGDLVESVG